MDPGQAPSCCDSSHPIDVLQREHRTILSVLDAAERELARLFGGAGIRQGFWVGICDFLENFADSSHHGKEEDLLFAELEQAGRGFGPTARMRADHETMRGMRTRMARALEAHDAHLLARTVHRLVGALREHIHEEDTILFPMARSVLDADAVRRLRQGFQRSESELIGEGTQSRYKALARSLTSRRDAVEAG